MKSFCLVLLFGVASLAFGTTYQVPSGQTPPAHSSGDTIRFQRGGIYAYDLGVYVVAGAHYMAYDVGTKPCFDATSDISALTSGSWIHQGGNTWSISCSTFPGRLWLSGAEYGVSGTTDGYGSTTPTSRYRWWWGSGTLYVWDGSSISSPASVYTSIRCAVSSHSAMTFSGKNGASFTNLEFRGGSTCIEIRNSSYLIFDSCAVGARTATYGLICHESDYGVIRDYCTFDRQDTVVHSFEFGGGSTHGDGQDAIALNCCNHWDIGHAYFGGTSHAGVNVDDGDAGGGTSQYNKIHDCEFDGTGSDYCRAFLMNDYGNGGLGYTAYNEFYRNYIYDMATMSQLGGFKNRVYYNLFQNQRHIPWMEVAGQLQNWVSSCACVQVQSDHYEDSVAIENNTFIDCDVEAISSASPSSNSPGHASIINNIIVNPGRANNSYAQYCGLMLWGTAYQSDIVRNNIIYSPNSSLTCFYPTDWHEPWDNGVSYVSVSSLQSAMGSLASGNLSGNPNVGNGGALSAGSIAIDAGLSLGFISDLNGLTVPYGSAPDIGAVEYQGDVSPPGAPTLSSPSNGATGIAVNTTWSWSSVSGATSYELWIIKDTAGTAYTKDPSVAGTSWSNATPLDSNTLYYWRVRASNSGGSSAWSGYWHFTTAAPTPPLTTPAVSTLSAPPNGSGSALPVTFQWLTSPTATSYEIEISDTTSFSRLTFDATTSGTTETLYYPSLSYSTQYYWRVNASNTSGTSSWSSPFVFTSGPTPATPAKHGYILLQRAP